MVKMASFIVRRGASRNGKTIIERQRCDLIASSVSDPDIYLEKVRKEKNNRHL